MVTFRGFTVCAVGVSGELATLAASAGVVSMLAASRMAAIFVFIVILPSEHRLTGTGYNDHANTFTPTDVKED